MSGMLMVVVGRNREEHFATLAKGAAWTLRIPNASGAMSQVGIMLLDLRAMVNGGSRILVSADDPRFLDQLSPSEVWLDNLRADCVPEIVAQFNAEFLHMSEILRLAGWTD